MPASRPRVTKWGTYIAEPYKSHKVALEQLIQLIDDPGENWAQADIDVFLPYPAGWPKSRRRQGAPHRRRPDADNFLKAATDALSAAGVGGDDGQLSIQAARKWYTTEPAGYLLFTLVPLHPYWLQFSPPTQAEEKLAKQERAFRKLNLAA